GSSIFRAAKGTNFSVPPCCGSAAMAQAATPSRSAQSRAAEPTRQGNSPGKLLMAWFLSLKRYDAQLATQPLPARFTGLAHPGSYGRLRPMRAVSREGNPHDYSIFGLPLRSIRLRTVPWRDALLLRILGRRRLHQGPH